MYIPEFYKEERPEVLQAFVKQHAFATLLTTTHDGIEASHLPLIYRPDQGSHGRLIGHMAKENQQWTALESAEDVLAIFQGPHCYVSPSLYESNFAVPTWNYPVVHIYGTPTTVTDESDLRNMLSELLSIYESHRDPAWSVSWTDERYGELLQAIVGFEIEITRIEAKFKLSQNRPIADQQAVIDAFRNSPDTAERNVAELMRQLRT